MRQVVTGFETRVARLTAAVVERVENETGAGDRAVAKMRLVATGIVRSARIGTIALKNAMPVLNLWCPRGRRLAYGRRLNRARKRWPTLTLDQRHAIIRTVLAHVVVKPGCRGYNRFDPSRFELIWRQ